MLPFTAEDSPVCAAYKPVQWEDISVSMVLVYTGISDLVF
jgi:hypothetical protein